MIKNLTINEQKLRDLHLRKLALGELQGPPTGYPSIDKEWLKYYNEEQIMTDMPEMKIVDYMMKNNKNNLKAIAINYFGKKIRYNALFKNIKKYAKAFTAQGIKQGDVVTLCLPNVPEAVYMFYALNTIGAVANMVHPLKSGNEIKKCINDVNSKNLIMIDNAYKEINNIVDETPLENIVVVTAGDSMPLLKKLIYKIKYAKKINNNKYIKLKKFLKNGKKEKEVINSKYKKDETAVIMYTGGTSGFSKGVELTNDNFNCMVHQQRATAENFEAGDSMLTIMPVFHGFGLCSSIHMPLSYGITTILIPKFKSSEFHKLIKKYKPNHIFGVPKLWKALISNEEINKMDLSFLKYIVSGGENMKDGLEEEINKFLEEHNCKSKIKKGYGLSEAVAGTTLSDDFCNEIGSIGIPLLRNTFKIVSPGTQKELNYNDKGEFCISGPTVMKQYYQNQKETLKTLQLHDDGKLWLHTGDMGYMTEDGMLYYTDRLTRMYVSGGFNIYPPVIENIIEKVKGVDSCAVVPMDHPYKDIKVPKVYIVLKENYELDDKMINQIKEECKENLDLHHQPFKFEQLDQLPITNMGDGIGKIDYKKLEVDYKVKQKLK